MAKQEPHIDIIQDGAGDIHVADKAGILAFNVSALARWLTSLDGVKKTKTIARVEQPDNPVVAIPLRVVTDPPQAG